MITSKITIILPCFNEERAISSCLNEIKEAIDNNQLKAEIIVVDNNSTDRTKEIVLGHQSLFEKLIVIEEKRQGYGFAYLAGLKAATGRYIFMADADSTYNFLQIPDFIKQLNCGYDMVVGNRFSGLKIKKSMPWSHRYIGNPFLSFLVRLFFDVKIKDIHCGARAITKEALNKITLYTGGMEFASEMIIKAAKANLKIAEIPVEYRKRTGDSKLHAMADAWRHLRFILLYSPLMLFFLPGIFIFLSGLFLMMFFYFFEPKIFGIQFYIHPLFLFSLMILLGYQIIIFGCFSKVYAVNHLGDKSKLIEFLFKHVTIEKMGIISLILIVLGLFLYLVIFLNWLRSGFGELNEVKQSIIGLTLTMFGAQTFFSTFMFSILGIKEK